MKINEQKTVVFRVSNKIKNVLDHKYFVNSRILATVDTLKYLGITISKNLSWKTHITSITSTAEKKLWFLRRKLKLAPQSVKLTAFLTYVRPTLEYASTIWDPFQVGLINELERVQRKAARFILSKYSSADSVTEMLNQLQLPPLSQRRLVARLKFLFLLSKHHFNIDISDYLAPAKKRTLRKQHDSTFVLPQLHIDTYANSFLPRTIKDWNALPSSVMQCTSVETFEKCLMTSLQTWMIVCFHSCT